MRQHIRAITTASFTIFAMLFGAANLMFPVRIGVQGGPYTLFGFAGFALTGILLPVLGLLTIVAFQGDYTAYFNRLGTRLGHLFIACCMFVIGPFIAMPRIVGLSHEMLSPFIPHMANWAFAAVFASIVFIATYKPGRLLDIIGYVLSPLKFLSIASIVGYGLLSGTRPESAVVPPKELFWSSFATGYETLDVLGAIFFGSIVVKLLTEFVSDKRQLSTKDAVKVCGISSLFASGLLALVYLGMAYLGALHGQGLEGFNEGQMLSHVSWRILGDYGAAMFGIMVFLACLTTMVTLAAIVGEYVQRIITQKRASYASCVASVLVVCTAVASFGLDAILTYSKQFIQFFYPLIIVITICNMLYKSIKFTPIQIPVIVTAAILFVYQFILPVFADTLAGLAT